MSRLSQQVCRGWARQRPAAENVLRGVGILQLIEDNLKLGTWSWDIASGRLTWSRGMYLLLGLDPAHTEPSIELYRQLLHPDDRLDFADPGGIAARAQVSDREFRIVRPGGEERWLRSCGEAVRGADGSVETMFGFAVDITDIKRGERAAARLAALNETLSTPPSPGQVRAARAFLGWSLEALAGNAQVSLSTVRRLESGGCEAVSAKSVVAVRSALEQAGIRFVGTSISNRGVDFGQD